MKEIFLTICTVFAMVWISVIFTGCTDNVTQAKDNLYDAIYLQDSRSELCFLVLHYRNSWSATHVPCTARVKSLLK